MDIMNAFRSVVGQIKSWSEDKLDNKVDKDGNKKLTDENYSSAEKSKLSQMATGLQILDGKLYLTNDDGLIEETATTLPSGSGSGGSSSASITLLNLLDSNEITVAYGGSANLVFEYASSESDANGIAYIYLSDTLKKTYSINPGENTIDVGDIIGEGVNSIKLTVSDIYSNAKSLSFVINAVSLKLTSTFDDSQIFDGDITIKYTVTGAVEKDVHMILDSVDTIIDTTSETGKQRSYTISGDDLYHGAHDIVLYMSSTIGDVEIVSNKLYFSIIAADEGATTPIISSVCTATTLTQGESLQINYMVYDPSNLETEIYLIIYGNGEIYSETTRIVDATKQTFVTRDLPVGVVDVKIIYGVIGRTHTVTVVENDIDVSIKTTSLEFELKAAGKSNSDSDRDAWENNGVSTTFEYVNYESTGWILDDNSDMTLRLSGDATATIHFQPFANDARSSGRTIELCFAIRDVNNRDAIAMSCYDGNIGFYVKADTAVITSEQTSVSCNYTDEEKIYVSFVIEEKTQYRLLYVYLNGVISGVKQYPESDNWQMSNPLEITVGSPYCSIDLYSIRSYSSALTQDEIKNNYIASITDIAEQLAIYEDNNIYDIYGNLSFDKCKEKIPVFVATGESLPTYKGDKKKMTVSFMHSEKPSLDYEDSSTLDVQGTSSQFFIRKNFKSKTSSYHMIDTDKIETNVICLKADYIDSSGSHNTSGANYVHTLYGDAKVLPQIENSAVRTTIFGYPCLLFWKSNSASTPEFIGKYNYNYEKSSSEAFGFTSDYPDAFSVEFCNNTSDACLFHGEIPDSWGDDFEYRHPDGYENIEDSGFKIMHSWVVSTYQDLADGSELEEIYTGVDGSTYTNDTAAYRLAKFKREFTEHFDMDFALVYYVYAMTGVYMDSLAKNLFLTTFDRQHWYCYWYDMDSSWGVNNEGVKYCTPFVEDIDMISGAKTFNGQDSTLWTNFRQAFADEIADFYAQLRSDKLLTYDKIIEYFITNQTNKWSISIFNEDADYKYISMLRSDGDASNLFQAQGTGEEYLKYFAKNRLKYLDSKWYAGDYPDNLVSLRIYTPSEWSGVEPNANITVTPYSNMYAGVRYKANGTLQQIRSEANTSVTFEAPDETFNDTETAVYGASEISSLGDLSPLYCGTVNLSKATKLVEIIVGSGADGYSNGNLKELSVGTNKLLKKIDIRNCPNLVDPLAISGCPNIEEIYAQGSGITAVELPSSGYLKKVYLPGTLTNLTVTNQQYIEEFELEGYDSLTTLRIEDAVNIPVEDIMLNAPNLNRIRLIDVAWTAESEEHLVQTIEKFKACLGLDASGNNTNNAVVTGRVYVSEKVSDEVIGDIYDSFPDLIVDDGSSEIYIVNYKDWDGTILYTLRLAEGEDAIDPIEEGYISAPFRESDEYYSYEYIGWSNIPTNVSRHYQVVASYNTKVAINFAVDGEIKYSDYVNYGSNAEDPVVNGAIEEPTKEGTDDLHYAFNGWDGSLLNITTPRTLNAVWTNVYPVRYYATDDAIAPYHVQWIKENESAYDPIIAGECTTPPEVVTENEMKYVFYSWDDIPTAVTSICKVYAQYDIYWAARFWNDTTLYLTEWIIDGGTVVEPKNYFEDYSNPICESTAQYDYTFSSWDGDFDTEMTEARDFYAVYTNTIRKYSVHFYNEDELLLTIENVPYGSSTSYTGSAPVKTGVDDPDEYVFKGWLPAPENITGETNCYALFKFTGYLFGKLSDDSEYGTVDDPNWDVINTYWSTIQSDVEAYKNSELTEEEFTTKYQIGGRMIIPIELSDGTSTIADVEIIGHNHDDLADNSGKAALTFFCKDLPNLYRGMNELSSDEGGWINSAMREFTNGELLESLPVELQAALKPVLKISDGGSSDKTLATSTDSCWLASYDEVGFTSGSYNLSGQGELYSSIFSSDKESRKKYIVDNTETGGWWLRSSYYTMTSNTMFWRVQKSGASYGDIQSGLFYVAFGFCI